MQTRYKCTSCGNEFHYKRKTGKKFPKTIRCHDCGEQAFRIMGNITTSVAKGKTGNSENGWDRFGADQPSEYIPMDFAHGESGRIEEHIDGRY